MVQAVQEKKKSAFATYKVKAAASAPLFRWKPTRLASPSPHLLGSPPPDAKSQTEQTQPLSLSLKPDPLAHLAMMPPPPALLLAEAAHGKASALCPNGALDLPPAALQPPIVASSSLAQPSTSSLHSHSSLAGTQPQPLSLVTKSLE